MRENGMRISVRLQMRIQAAFKYPAGDYSAVRKGGGGVAVMATVCIR